MRDSRSGHSAPARGSLYAIGGRAVRRGDASVLEGFVTRAGGAAARLVVISTAAADPEPLVAEYAAAFRELGVPDVSFFHQVQRAEAAVPELLDAIDRAGGVFFTGGNQLKLVTTLAGTIAEKKLHERYHTGLHIAGTSAGASAMSAVMIARGRDRSSARLDSVRMSPGLGIIENAIIDQHFRERDRFGRLLTAVLCNPSMLGFGLDEGTAFELDREDRVSVVGSGTLTIVDGSELEATNLDVVPEDASAAFAGMRVHVLSDGWSFDLRSRRVQRPTLEPTRREVISR